MFWSKGQVFALIIFTIVLAAIPLSAVALKQTQILKSGAFEKNGKVSQVNVSISGNETVSYPTPTPPWNSVPATSPLSELNTILEVSPTLPPPAPAGSTPTPTPISRSVNLAFGPTLNMSISIEGRPEGQQTAKVFIGLASGSPVIHPTYILTLTADFPSSGKFSGISLAGLNPGSTYTAYIKGPAQIDTAAPFVMGPTETILSSGQAIQLLTGDLNEDNTVTQADSTILQGLYGTTSSSKIWNANADFNFDGVVNTFDLLYIIKNMGKVGASGTWLSTASATPTPGTGGPEGGYWLYIP